MYTIYLTSNLLLYCQMTGGGLQRQELWAHIVKKEIPRAAKQFSLSRHIVTTSNKKVLAYTHTHQFTEQPLIMGTDSK